MPAQSVFSWLHYGTVKVLAGCNVIMYSNPFLRTPIISGLSTGDEWCFLNIVTEATFTAYRNLHNGGHQVFP